MQNLAVEDSSQASLGLEWVIKRGKDRQVYLTHLKINI